MRATTNNGRFSVRRAVALVLATVVACNLFFPSFAQAMVRVDDVELNQGVNEVGGGTATLTDSNLEMEGVTAAEFYTDEDLTIDYAGGNAIDETTVAGDAEVEMNFSGENDVTNVAVTDDASLTINANEHNTFDEVLATDNSNLNLNVDGTAKIGSVDASGAANVAVRGAQQGATIDLGAGRDISFLDTESGNLSVENVRVNLNAKEAILGSALGGTVTIDSSSLVAGEDNGFVFLGTCGTMLIKDSSMEFGGMVYSTGQMTIDNSNMRTTKPTAFGTDSWPHRVSSRTGIDLRNELNGIVLSGMQEGKPIFFLDTNENFGRVVELWAGARPADPTPAADETPAQSAPIAHVASKALPRTADPSVALLPLLAAGVLLVIGAFLAGRLELAPVRANGWVAHAHDSRRAPRRAQRVFDALGSRRRR